MEGLSTKAASPIERSAIWRYLIKALSKPGIPNVCIRRLHRVERDIALKRTRLDFPFPRYKLLFSRFAAIASTLHSA